VELADQPGRLAAVAADLTACGASIVQLADGGLVRLRQLSDEEGRGRIVLAAEVGGTIVGLGCYDVDTIDPDAEISVTVEDRHRRRGIGTLLMTELALLRWVGGGYEPVSASTRAGGR
jgi:GNAT superfamily N-acetyltransferase